MIKWIRKLLGLCDHEWKIIEQYSLYDHAEDTELPWGVQYVLQCTKCGNVKDVIV